MVSVGNLVFLYPQEHIPFCSAASSQFLSYPCPLFSSRPCYGFRQTVPSKGTCKFINVTPSNFLRTYIHTVEEGTCKNLSSNGTVQALSSRLFTGYKGRFSRGKFLVKSENGNSNSQDDMVKETLQASIERSKKVLALQKELLQKIAERRKLVSTLKDNLGSSADKIKVFNKTVGLQEDQELDNTAESIEVLNESTNIEEKYHDVTIEETSESLFTTEAAEVLPKDWSSPGAVPESRGVQVQVEEEHIQEKEEDGNAKIGEHSGVEEVKDPPLAGPNVMNIIMVAAECAPWSKTGGLGDVVGALPKALARRGHRVMAVAPRYRNYHEGWDTGIRTRYKVVGQDMEVGYFHGYIDGVDFVFIDNPIFHGKADNIYGGSGQDVLIRMILFCKAAVEVPWHVPCGGICYGDGNLVFIANDWHTSLLPVYLKAYYHDQGLMEYTRCVLVIHNIAHQGRGPVDDFHLLGLPDHHLDKFKLNDPIGGEHLNIFMAGLKTAHRLVAVSHGYAWECQTQEGGWGLHDVMKENAWKLRGIVNGIDDKEWNPELDVHLKSDGYANYSVETLETGKPTCKSALQRELGFPVRSEVPLIGFIGRLDQQKGVDLIADAMPWMMDQDLQVVMLGMGRKDLENILRSFEAQYYDKFRGWVGFSVETSHRITAGADILLMPSRFEPCGLNQLYAMRYGTVPVVHAVGGLKDTVKPFDPYTESGLGWAFEWAEASALIHALGNALWTYRDFKQSWRGIQKRCMNQNLGWDNAAQQYEEVLVAAKYQW